MRRWLALSAALSISGLPCLAMAQAPNVKAVIFPPMRSAVAVQFVGPLDIVAGAKFCFSVRACSLAKAGTKIADICNSGDANCAVVNSTAAGDFDVATAQGAPLNCGGAGGTCTFRTWYDQIGSNCTGPCDATNATPANRPILVFNCTGGRPCARFAAASSQVLDVASAISTFAQPVSVSVVTFRNGNPGNFGAVWSMTVSNILIGGWNTASLARVNFGIDITATAADSVYHTELGVGNGASSNFYIDGSATSGNEGTSGFANNIKIGAVATQFWNGDIPEIVGWANDFSSGVTCASQAACASAINSNQKSWFGF